MLSIVTILGNFVLALLAVVAVGCITVAAAVVFVLTLLAVIKWCVCEPVAYLFGAKNKDGW